MIDTKPTLRLSADTTAVQIGLLKASRDVHQMLILSMCATYGAPDDVGPATAWHDVGTDLCRVALLDEIEDFRGFDITDEEREAIRTVGDLIALAGANPP